VNEVENMSEKRTWPIVRWSKLSQRGTKDIMKYLLSNEMGS